jgi:type IV secretory pathway ATPase VirB11/archaellum biosynthesis ATPase
MKDKREFLEPLKHSDSYYRIHVDDDTRELELKLSDCDRRIWLYFGKPGNKRAIAKIKRLKACIDSIHDYLVGE